jgi:hypothetical protein
MRLRIRHTTTYDYATPVAASTQVVRLTPRSDPGQRVLEWEVRLEVLAPASRQPHPLRLGMPSLPIAAPISRPTALTLHAHDGSASVPPRGPHIHPVRRQGHSAGSVARGVGPTLMDARQISVHSLRFHASATGDDGYGNRAHLVSLVVPHVATRLVATGIVQTSPAHDGAHDHPPSLPLPIGFATRATPAMAARSIASSTRVA